MDRLMDNNELEQEKGITIVSKVTSVKHKEHIINIVDTPGHQDFGGEVERVLSMVDGVLLLVCATEGTMRQTKYVLQKAIQNNLKPIVIINKVDRDSARIDEVEEEILELFFDMNMDEEFINFKTFFSSAKLYASFNNIDEVNHFIKSNKGKSIEEMMVNPQSENGMVKILDYILENVSTPALIGPSTEKPKLLISQIEHDILFGKIIRGKIESGTIKVGDTLACYNKNTKLVEKSKVFKMFKNNGLEREEIVEGFAGDIVSISGFTKAKITNTLCSVDEPFSISSPDIDKPLLCVEVMVNNGPLSGQNIEAKMSFNDLYNRLKDESEKDLALEIQKIGSTKILVFGRGELHIGVIMEKMRREGYEMLISAPKVTMKMNKKTKMEPIEHVKIECELNHVALILDRLMNRKANIEDQISADDGERQILIADIPSRGLLGLKMDLQSMTQNTVSVQNWFKDWEEHRGTIEKKRKNSIVASHDGVATGYAIYGLEKFGNFFIKPGQKIYKGQVVGISHDKEENVNVCKDKRLTNIRSAGNDENIKLTPPKIFTIEEAISFIGEDEWIEVTKDFMRLRKIELNSDVRKTSKKRKTEDNDLIISD